MINVVRVSIGVVMGLFLLCGSVGAQSSGLTGNLYDLGKLKPFDSELKVKSGEMAPDFTLPAISGEKITLSQYRGKKMWCFPMFPLPGRRCAVTSGRAMLLPEKRSLRTMRYFWASPSTTSPPFLPGRVKWDRSGSRSSPTSGPTVPWQKNTACCVPMDSRKGH